MKCEIRQSFVKDSLKLSPQVQNDIGLIINKIEKADKITAIPACKKLKGFKSA